MPERVLLAVGFEHYCALQWGLSRADIERSFDGNGDDLDRDRVRMAAGLVGTLLARGSIRSWARSMGVVWTLDRGEHLKLLDRATREIGDDVSEPDTDTITVRT